MSKSGVRIAITVGISMVLAMSAVGSVHAASVAPQLANWTQWGYNARHTGYNPSETVLTRGNVGHLVRAFSTPLYDEYGDPIVVNGVVYISDSDLSGTIQAIDGTTGEVDRTLEGPCEGGGSSDPAFASGNVWVGFTDPGLGAIQGNGVGVSCIEAGDLYQSPPVAGGGSVYAGGEGGELVAIDAITGKVRWMIGPTYGPSVYYGTPTISADGSDLYVASTTYGSGGGSVTDIDELDAATGARIWSRDIDFTCSGFSSYNEGIADAGSLLYTNGCDLEALSASTGAVEWHSAIGLGPTDISPLVAGNLVYGSTTDAGIAAFNATTGKLVWGDTKVAPGEATIANGVVYVSEDSSIVMLNSSTGAQLGRLQAPSSCRYSGDPVPVDGHVYVALYGCASGANLRLIAYVP